MSPGQNQREQTEAERLRFYQLILFGLVVVFHSVFFGKRSITPALRPASTICSLALLASVPSGCRSWRETEQFQGERCENRDFNQRQWEKMACSLLSVSFALAGRGRRSDTLGLSGLTDRTHTHAHNEQVVPAGFCLLSFCRRRSHTSVWDAVQRFVWRWHRISRSSAHHVMTLF